MNTQIINRSGAQAVVETLRILCVKRVFGLPGIQNIELFDAFADAPFSTLTPTNESAAVFMADAHARVTGELGAAVVTAGPGLTNALSAIAEAQLDSTPMLVLVASSDERKGKSFQLHQIPQEKMLTPMVKGWFKPAGVENIPQTLFRAAKLATQGENGVAIVELPSFLLMERGRFTFSLETESGVSEEIHSQLDEVATRLRSSPSVGIYVGTGAMGATEQLKALSELLQAPVATTISGRGVIPEDHPLSVGYGFGRSGTAPAWRAFRNVHTLLAIGCKYGETATGGFGLKLPPEHINIDISPASLGVNYPASLTVTSDAKAALTGLLSRLAPDRRPINAALQERIREARDDSETKASAEPALTERVHPSRFLRCLRRHLDRNAILVTDCGAHQFWALNDFPVYEPRTFLAPADFQTMGFSIPAAIGAKLAQPQRQVVSLVGDGGFLMSGFECLNAVRWNAKIMVVVFRDGAWGLIQDAQKRVYRRSPFSKIPTPDFRLMAESFGMKFVRIGCDGEIEAGLTEAIAADGPVLVDVNVDYSESPPYVKGSGRQMFRNLPLGLKAGVALRLGKRHLFPPKQI